MVTPNKNFPSSQCTYFVQMPQSPVSLDLMWVNLLHHLVFPTSNSLHKPIRENKTKNINTSATILSRNINTLPKSCTENKKTSNLELEKGWENVLNTSPSPEFCREHFYALANSVQKDLELVQLHFHFFNWQTRSLISSNDFILMKYHCK